MKYNPISVSREHLSGSATVDTSFTVLASTRSAILCLRNRFHHICSDNEEVSLGGDGITTYGVTDASSGAFQHTTPAT